MTTTTIMGGVLAELLAVNGCNVSLVTPAPLVSYWSQFTLEQERIPSKLMKLGVKLFVQNTMSEIGNDFVKLSNTISGEEIELPRDGVMLVSDRTPNDELYRSLTLTLSQSIAREDVDAAMRHLGAAVRSQLEVFPDQVAPLVAPVSDLDEVNALLTEHCRQVLTAVAEALERQAAGLAASEA